jgi:hypothetical protein
MQVTNNVSGVALPTLFLLGANSMQTCPVFFQSMLHSIRLQRRSFTTLSQHSQLNLANT